MPTVLNSLPGDATHPLKAHDFRIAGHAQPIAVRVFEPLMADRSALLPVVLYLHGGGFIGGSVDEAQVTALTLARDIPAVVVVPGYSLAPAFPFPHAAEDVWLCAQWIHANAHEVHGDRERIGVAGHDAGGNLATVSTMIARDRGGPALLAQALLAPLLDPSMTRMADERRIIAPDLDATECARCYRAYLPSGAASLHPYAAPLESRRLNGLPPAFIASAEHDLLHIEAERYAGELINAGIPVQVTRYLGVAHQALATHAEALADVAAFLRKKLSALPAPWHQNAVPYLSQ